MRAHCICGGLFCCGRTMFAPTGGIITKHVILSEAKDLKGKDGEKK